MTVLYQVLKILFSSTTIQWCNLYNRCGCFFCDWCHPNSSTFGKVNLQTMFFFIYWGIKYPVFQFFKCFPKKEGQQFSLTPTAIIKFEVFRDQKVRQKCFFRRATLPHQLVLGQPFNFGYSMTLLAAPMSRFLSSKVQVNFIH